MFVPLPVTSLSPVRRALSGAGARLQDRPRILAPGLTRCVMARIVGCGAESGGR